MFGSCIENRVLVSMFLGEMRVVFSFVRVRIFCWILFWRRFFLRGVVRERRGFWLGDSFIFWVDFGKFYTFLVLEYGGCSVGSIWMSFIRYRSGFWSFFLGEFWWSGYII